jgi:uncharacterized repeat protein (TIGR01451 family)
MLTTNTDQPTSSPKPTKKWSWKAAATVFGLALFFTGALVAVIIVQKQRTPEGPAVPVAPTAPVSEPSATIPVDPAACTLGFTVLGDPSAVTCESKVAYADFLTPTQLSGIDKSKLPQPLTAVLPGTEFVYVISVTASGPSTENVIITDELPAGVTYVGINPSSKQPIAYDKATRTVSAKIGTFTADSLSRTIEFKVKTTDDMAVGAFTNTAKVQLAGEAESTAQSCAVALTIPPRGTASCEKRAITNFTSKNGVGVNNSIVQRGNVFVYQIKVLASEQTTGGVKLLDTLPAGIEFMEDPDNTPNLIVSADKRSISMELGELGTTTANKTTTIEFKVKVADTATGTLKNTVAVTTGTSTTAYECNQSVVVQQVGSPPAPGCNEACKVNADCSNSAHICYTIADGTGRCRLDTNATNESCNAPTAPGTPSVPVVPGQPAPAQPTLPEELPVAGAEDWANWLKAGLLTLGAGAILLLLL